MKQTSINKPRAKQHLVQSSNENTDKSNDVLGNILSLLESRNCSNQATRVKKIDGTACFQKPVITMVSEAPSKPTDLFPSPPIKRYTPLEGSDKVVGFKNGRRITIGDCFSNFSIYLDEYARKYCK